MHNPWGPSPIGKDALALPAQRPQGRGPGAMEKNAGTRGSGGGSIASLDRSPAFRLASIAGSPARGLRGRKSTLQMKSLYRTAARTHRFMLFGARRGWTPRRGAFPSGTPCKRVAERFRVVSVSGSDATGRGGRAVRPSPRPCGLGRRRRPVKRGLAKRTAGGCKRSR